MLLIFFGRRQKFRPSIIKVQNQNERKPDNHVVSVHGVGRLLHQTRQGVRLVLAVVHRLLIICSLRRSPSAEASRRLIHHAVVQHRLIETVDGDLLQKIAGQLRAALSLPIACAVSSRSDVKHAVAEWQRFVWQRQQFGTLRSAFAQRDAAPESTAPARC